MYFHVPEKQNSWKWMQARYRQIESWLHINLMLVLFVDIVSEDDGKQVYLMTVPSVYPQLFLFFLLIDAH